MLPVFSQERRIDDADLAQKINSQRKLKSEACTQDQRNKCVDIAGDGPTVFNIGIQLKIGEEVYSVWSDYKITKHHTQKKQQRHPKNNASCVTQFFFSYGRSGKIPELQEYIRKC